MGTMFAFGVGLATRNDRGEILDTWFPQPARGLGEDVAAAIRAVVTQREQPLDAPQLGALAQRLDAARAVALAESCREVAALDRPVLAVALDDDDEVQGTAEAYLKLDLRNSAQAAVDQARFALVALTRYVEDRPDWVNTISTQDRLRLRTALELVTAYGLAGEDWYSGRFSELARRMAVATGHQDAAYVAAGALAADNVVTLAQVREGKDVQPPWTCADLRLRMGSAARLFVDLKWGYNLSVDPPRARGTVSVQAGALDRLGRRTFRADAGIRTDIFRIHCRSPHCSTRLYPRGGGEMTVHTLFRES
jgi:hypothetical protein